MGVLKLEEHWRSTRLWREGLRTLQPRRALVPCRVLSGPDVSLELQSMLADVDGSSAANMEECPHTPDTLDANTLAGSRGRKTATPGSLEQWRLDHKVALESRRGHGSGGEVGEARDLGEKGGEQHSEQREESEPARFYGLYQRGDGAKYEGEFLDADLTVQDGLGIFSWCLSVVLVCGACLWCLSISLPGRVCFCMCAFMLACMHASLALDPVALIRREMLCKCVYACICVRVCIRAHACLQGFICVCSRECMPVCGLWWVRVRARVYGRPDGALYSGEWRCGQKSGTGWVRKETAGWVGGALVVAGLGFRV